MTNTVSVVIPPALRERAKVARINISAFCRVALAEYVEQKEQEIGAGRQALTPTTTPIKEGNEDVGG